MSKQTLSEQNHSQTGELMIRTVARPADANSSGDIFGGWVMAQMDVAGGLYAYELAKCRVVTAALDGMSFHKPVKIGDVLCVYSQLVKQGRTSLTVHVQAWVKRDHSSDLLKVTEADFKFVALNEQGKPSKLPVLDV